MMAFIPNNVSLCKPMEVGAIGLIVGLGCQNGTLNNQEGPIGYLENGRDDWILTPGPCLQSGDGITLRFF